MTTASISQDYLIETLTRLGAFSAPGPGVTRLAYDRHWCDAQRWLAARAGELGLEATADAYGNLFLHDPALRPGSRAILAGSHLDTVRNGGLYDGAYGAVCGMLAAAELRSAGGTPVVGIVTAEEEGSRFSGDMLGARGLLGRVRDEEFESLTDAAGVPWREALREAASRTCVDPSCTTAPCFSPEAMVEIHIEQGPVLERECSAVGVVDRIIGYRRARLRIEGAARHAGTTPMRMRRDALAAASEMILVVERAALEMGEPAVATAGYVRPEPGLFNVVPGACEVWVEMRHVESGALEALDEMLAREWRGIAGRRGVALTIERLAGLEPVALTPDLARRALAMAERSGISCRVMTSGAGHDAMVFAAAGVPTALLFVPCRDGLSHCPEEFAEPADLWRGYTFFRDLLGELARQGGAA